MTLKLKNIFVLAFACILLTSCNNPIKSPQTHQPIKATPKDVVNETKKLPITTEYEEEVVKVIDCDMLKSEDAKSSCKQTVQEVTTYALYSEIRRTFDLKRCDELSQDMMKSCKTYIEESNVQGPVSEDQLTVLRESIAMVYPTVEGAEDEVADESEAYYDPSKCSALTAPDLKTYCKNQINSLIAEEKMREIVETGDATACEQLEDLEFVDSCKAELGIYPEEPIESTEGEGVEPTEKNDIEAPLEEE